MIHGDALFFYQLILSICNHEMSNVLNNSQKAFRVPVSDYTNKYVYFGKQRGGNYGQNFGPENAAGLLSVNGSVVINKNSTTIHDWWCTDNEK